jgi:signal transduction histidine kinase
MVEEHHVSTEQALLAGKTALLYDNALLGQLATIIAASLLAWVLSETLPGAVVLGWWLVVVVVAAARLVLAKAYHRARPDEFCAAAWCRRFILGATVSGLVWGAGALLFMAGAPKHEQLFVAFVVAGMVAGAVPILAPVFAAFRIFALTIVVPLAGVVLWKADSRLDWAFGLIAILFLVAVMRSARAMHDRLDGSLRLAFEKSQLVADLERSREAAEEASRMKSQFLATMSHEIRTPMNGVMGMTDLLMTTGLDDEQRDYAGLIKSSAVSLLTIINDVLDFSKIEAGRMELHVNDFDLVEMLDETLRVLAIQAREKGLKFSRELDTSLPPLLRGDPGRLRQVLINLVGNAIKFTDTGEISVKVAPIRLSDTRALLRFDVRDSGIGMPADKLTQLFTPFNQLDGGATRKFGGTGLGLSISRRLAEMMGGEVGVESEEGRGSTFWFTAELEVLHLPEAIPST